MRERRGPGAPVADPRALDHRLPRADEGRHEGAHGAPLGADEVRATKVALGWDPTSTSTC